MKDDNVKKYDISKMVHEYLEGKSMKQIAIELNIDRSTVKSILMKNNIKVRKNHRKIKFDENFFERETNQLYYFWGFVLGDGTCIESGIGIGLNIKDVEVLKKFCRWLSMDENAIKYYTYNNHPTCRLNIYKNADFSKFGVVPRKTTNPAIPNIENEFIIPFLLGLLDADGHISFNKMNKKGSRIFDIQLVGNKVIIDWFAKTIIDLGFTGHIEYICNDNWKKIKIRRKQDVVNLIEILKPNLYQNLIFTRKWQSSIDFLNGCVEIYRSASEINKDKVLELYFKDKKNMIDIARILNIDPRTVSKIIKIKC